MMFGIMMNLSVLGYFTGSEINKYTKVHSDLMLKAYDTTWWGKT